VDEYLDVPQLNSKESFKKIKFKQTEKKKKESELAVRDDVYARRFKKRL